MSSIPSVSSSIICNFCQKNFKTKATLDFHQKTNKSCLEKQGKKTQNKEFKCDYCDKILSTNLRLNSHMEICKIKLKNIDDEKDKKLLEILKENEKYKIKLVEKDENIEKIIEEKDKKIYKISKENEDYKSKIEKMITQKDDFIEKVILEYKIKLLEKEEYISKLEQMLEKANSTISDIAKQPKNITTNTNTNSNNRIKNNTNIQNNFDINDIEKITNILENHLTPEVLCKGQKGVAEMLKQHLLQTKDGEPLYECTDISRQKFEFINKDGILEVDSKANKLITSLNKANIYDKAHMTGQKLWQTEDGKVDHQAQHVHMPKVTEVLEINQDSSKLRSHLASITSR